MPEPLETASTHEPALSASHEAGARIERQSPAERALAPEAAAPLQSANAIADDGTYVGQGGGYGGGHAVADGSGTGGEGTYGYPAGPGVGMPGGEHQPVDQKPWVDPAPVPER